MAALAEPPWNVDDPETTPEGIITFYGVYLGEKFNSHESLESFPYLSLTWGALQSTELGFSVPLNHYDSVDGENMGIGDGALSLKHRFWENLHGDAAAIASQLSLPTGDHDKSLGAGTTILSLGPTAQWQHGLFKLVAQVFASKKFDVADISWLYGLALNYQITDNLFIGGQVFSTSPQTFAGIGGGYHLTPTIAAQLQFSQELSRKNSNDTQQIVYAGLTWDVSVSKSH